MNRQSIAIFSVVSTLILCCAAFLYYLQNQQKMGQPGVRVVQEPVRNPDGEIVAEQSVALPENVLHYDSEPLPVSELELGWLPPDTTYGRRRYKAPDNFWVDVSVVLMGSDRTSIHKPQYCLTGQGFAIDRTENVTIPILEPRPYDLEVKKLTTSKEYRAKGGKKIPLRAVYVYWFVADDQLTPEHRTRMWWMARDLITEGVLQRWAYVSYFAVCPVGKEEEAFQRIKHLIQASVPKFQEAVPIRKPPIEARAGGPWRSARP